MRIKRRVRVAPVLRLRPGVARVFVCFIVTALAIAASISTVAAVPRAQETAPAPTVAPAPTPSPADLKLAASFAQDGTFGEAVGAYNAVVARGTAADRLAARLGLAQLYYADGQFGTAARQLDSYLLEAPRDADVRDAQILLAEALQRAGDSSNALRLYEAYINAAGGAATYARIGRAEALAQGGRVADANAEATALLNGATLPASARRGLILSMAQTLELSSPRDAIGWYDRLRQQGWSHEDQALALWRSALLKRDLGEGPPLIETWTALIQRYPETSTAAAIVDVPPPYPPNANYAALDTYYTGLVYYRAGRNEDSRAALQGSLDRNAGANGPLAARASFYLGALDERDGDASAAIAHYARVVELNAKSDLADDALWWQGRLLEAGHRQSDAWSVYQTLASAYIGSSFASEARFRLGLMLYDAGRYKEATSAFAAIAKATGDVEQQRAQLWQGKASLGAGDSRGAKSTWVALRTSAPDDYYGLRAAVLLGNGQGKLKDAGARTQGVDWGAIDRWLRDAKGADPALERQTVMADPHWTTGSALLQAGLRRESDAEFGLLLANASGDAGLLLQLSRAFYGTGAYDLSARAAAGVLNQVPEAVAAKAPADLWRAAYPALFSGILHSATAAEAVPDVLMLALVRQESFFDPLAGSPAGAQGLTQVVPSTGEAIAKDLGVQRFEAGDLFRPALSLQFGAHYLRQQLDAFHGNAYQALAAYNAGPGNAQRWLDAARGDTDRFVAEVDLSETMLYLRLVSENLARYRQLYDGLDAPALPKE